MSADKLKHMLIHYYEVDLNNCTMTQEDWIEELAKAMTDSNYRKKFEQEYNEYLNTITS